MIIYKYPLKNPMNEFFFEKDAKILSVINQNDTPVMYVLHIEPKDVVKHKVKVAVIMTGQPFDFAVTRFIGTVVVEDGMIVLHVYEAL